MRVTIDVFSGRPNPSWQLRERHVRELRDRYLAIAPALRPATHADEPPKLGFRGFILSEDAPGELVPLTVPESFRIAAPAEAKTAIAPVKAIKEEVDTGNWLLTTAAGAITDDLARTINLHLDEMRPADGKQTVRSSMMALTTESDGDDNADDVELATAMSSETCTPRLAPMRLDFWNSPFIEPHNNCYNYATNFASGTLAQPGRRSGRIYASFRCADVVAAAKRDGLRAECDGDLAVIALGIWPGFDFHWWRLHPDGFWAHKIGWWPAQNRDNSFRIIGNGLTPATCDRGLYSEFCGYYFAPPSMWVM